MDEERKIIEESIEKRNFLNGKLKLIDNHFENLKITH